MTPGRSGSASRTEVILELLKSRRLWTCDYRLWDNSGLVMPRGLEGRNELITEMVGRIRVSNSASRLEMLDYTNTDHEHHLKRLKRPSKRTKFYAEILGVR